MTQIVPRPGFCFRVCLLILLVYFVGLYLHFAHTALMAIDFPIKSLMIFSNCFI